MSDTYHYEDGAVHNDHKRVVNISGVSGKDLQGLLKAFLSDEAEVVKAIREEPHEPSFTPERLIRAVEAVQSFFWAQSSWAVVYCVCRDHLDMAMSVVDFERMIETLPFTRTPDYPCPKGTVQKALDNNGYMKYPIARWQEYGAKKRALQLAEKLASALD